MFEFEKYSGQLTLLLLTTLDFFTQPKLRRSLNQEVDLVTFEHLAKSHAHSIGTAGTTPSRPPNTRLINGLTLANQWLTNNIHDYTPTKHAKLALIPIEARISLGGYGNGLNVGLIRR